MAELIALALVALAAWRGGSDALGSTSASLFPSLYLAIPIGAMVAIRESGGPAALSLLMLTVIVSDSAQYYTGRLLGRRLLAPAISPKKTIEGAIGGFVFGTAVFAVVGAWWLPIVPAIARVGMGMGIVAVGIAGDLFESMLKRSANVKDSSAIIPGHGGILDRIDALLFAAPFFYRASAVSFRDVGERPLEHETHRHSRIDRFHRPERAGGRRCAPRSPAGGGTRGRRECRPARRPRWCATGRGLRRWLPARRSIG